MHNRKLKPKLYPLAYAICQQIMEDCEEEEANTGIPWDMDPATLAIDISQRVALVLASVDHYGWELRQIKGDSSARQRRHQCRVT